MDGDKWLCGLNFARELNFTDNQYEEAVKGIDSPVEANQLVKALINISNSSSKSIPLAGSYVDDSSQITGATTRDNPATNTLKRASLPVVDDRTGMTTLNGALEGDTRLDRSASSSGYSSFVKVPSSEYQSYESLTTRRSVYIDGPNVARTHGKDAAFSWTGIKLSVDWFLSRNHKVKVFVPADRCESADEQILTYLNGQDVIIKTPVGCNDDMFIIEAAKQNNAVIVSNDFYRDEAKSEVDLKLYVHLNRLPFIFVDDQFIPAKDPRGRTGPRLEELLTQTGQNVTSKQQFCRISRTRPNPAKTYQKPRYQSVYCRNGHDGSNTNYQKTPIRKATMSLPIEAKTALYQTKSHDL